MRALYAIGHASICTYKRDEDYHANILRIFNKGVTKAEQKTADEFKDFMQSLIKLGIVDKNTSRYILTDAAIPKFGEAANIFPQLKRRPTSRSERLTAVTSLPKPLNLEERQARQELVDTINETLETCVTLATDLRDPQKVGRLYQTFGTIDFDKSITKALERELKLLEDEYRLLSKQFVKQQKQPETARMAEAKSLFEECQRLATDLKDQRILHALSLLRARKGSFLSTTGDILSATMTMESLVEHMQQRQQMLSR